MRVSYESILTWLLIAYFYFCAVYFVLFLVLKLPAVVFLVVTIAVLSAMMYFSIKDLDEAFSRVEREIEELRKYVSTNADRNAN